MKVNDKADHFYLEDMMEALYGLLDLGTERECKRTLYVKKKSDINFEKF